MRFQSLFGRACGIGHTKRPGVRSQYLALWGLSPRRGHHLPAVNAVVLHDGAEIVREGIGEEVKAETAIQ